MWKQMAFVLKNEQQLWIKNILHKEVVQEVKWE